MNQYACRDYSYRLLPHFLMISRCAAYYVDDGKGGKVYLNVSCALAHTSVLICLTVLDRATCMSACRNFVLMHIDLITALRARTSAILV